MSDKQVKLDERYLRMAKIWAENSYCVRRQVGALVVKDKMIISDGYNGTPSGFENICEDDNNVTKPYVLHADRYFPNLRICQLPCHRLKESHRSYLADLPEGCS